MRNWIFRPHPKNVETKNVFYGDDDPVLCQLHYAGNLYSGCELSRSKVVVKIARIFEENFFGYQL